jgi:hypothetical protein
MQYSLYFELQELPPGLNKLLRMNWGKRKRIFDSIQNQVHYLILGKKPSTPLNKYQITFTRHTTRPLDADNLVASFKPVLDSLVLSGVIQDDKWGMTDNVSWKQIKAKKIKDQKISVEVKG